MLLELITGHRPVDLTGQIMEDSLVDWARPYLAQALEDGNYDELADPKMEGNYAPNEMASMISCAAASVRHSGKRRPKMSQIVRALEGGNLLMEETTEIPKPKQRSNGSGGTSCSTESAYDTVAYNVDMMKFRNMVMDDNKEQALLSSQYGATSEYGLK
ncbi:hypothetical protein Leryth_022329 [Lithospermum erythrorhizon]|nr:hypothetical protein Leryth_022329 [Lithospermum erythrorhizon]